MKNLTNQIILDIQGKLAQFLGLRPLVFRARKQIPDKDVQNLQKNTELYTRLENTEKKIFSLLPKAIEIQKGSIRGIPSLFFEVIELNKLMNNLTNETVQHLIIIKRLYGGNFEIPRATALDYLQFIPLFMIPIILLLLQRNKK